MRLGGRTCAARALTYICVADAKYALYTGFATFYATHTVRGLIAINQGPYLSYSATFWDPVDGVCAPEIIKTPADEATDPLLLVREK